jgi:glycosyltransferase involved in cell wall biosynthesis
MTLSPLEWILLGVFAGATTIQLIYYWIIFGRLAFYKLPMEINNSNPPVSIVIVARNEYHNLSKNLPLFLKQLYPDFEVVVVNHMSDDDTKDLLNDFKIQYSKLKVVNITQDLNFFKGKKFPLSLGIKSASNDIVLLTDADCEPNSENWIQSMVRNYTPDVQVVLGYGPYLKKKGFVNMLIRYDTLIVAMQYLSYALAGFPYMGVGRNLSYTRSIFFAGGGFTSHYKISSGDDDLLIGQIADKKNTRIEVSPDSFIYSEPKISFLEWVKQKQRHLTTGKFYKAKFKILLGTFSITQMLFYACFILLLFFSDAYYIITGIFILRFISQLIVQKKVTNLLQEKQLLIISPLLEVIYILIMPIISFKSLFLKSVQWK